MTDFPQPLSELAEAAEGALDRGLEFLGGAVSREGCWRCEWFRTEQPDDRRPETNPFVGALGSLSLHGVADPRAAAILARTKRYTAATMERPGVWRYWPSLPPDADSTSVCNLAVGLHPMLLSGWYERVLLQHRTPEGLFHTWLANKPVNDADAVVNANVVACLGDTPDTRRAQRWLERLICDGTDAGEIYNYWDVMDLYRAVVRAHRLHPTVFAGILPVIADRIAARRGADGAYGDGLRTSLAVTALRGLGAPLQGVSAAATLDHLLGLQMPDGGWPDSWLASGPAWPEPRQYAFTSRAYDTANCIEAIGDLLGKRANEAPATTRDRERTMHRRPVEFPSARVAARALRCSDSAAHRSPSCGRGTQVQGRFVSRSTSGPAGSCH